MDRADGREELHESVLDYCERELARLRADAPELPFDFTCGFAGYLGYELKAELRRRSSCTAPRCPTRRCCFCDRLIAFDHHEQRVHLRRARRRDGAPAAEAWLAATERELEAIAAPRRRRCAARRRRRRRCAFAAREDRDAYLANIAACKHEIFEGESYEICLTTELHSDGAIEPLAAYRALRARNPAPHAALLRLGDVSVLELLARALPARRPRADRRVQADQGHRPRAPPTRSRTPTARPRCAPTTSRAPRTS